VGKALAGVEIRDPVTRDLWSITDERGLALLRHDEGADAAKNFAAGKADCTSIVCRCGCGIRLRHRWTPAACSWGSPNLSSRTQRGSTGSIGRIGVGSSTCCNPRGRAWRLAKRSEGGSSLRDHGMRASGNRVSGQKPRCFCARPIEKLRCSDRLRASAAGMPSGG